MNNELQTINELSSINSSALGGVNLGSFYLSNQLNLGNLWQKINLPRRSLLAKTGQSKHINYAKRTQFFKKSNVYNLIKNNKLQRKIQIGHLVKTNPNKANLKWQGHFRIE